MSPRIGLNFNELLRKSIEIVDEEGWDVLTISYLAKKLTIQPPSIYNHVKNLEELKNSISLFGINQLYEELKKSMSGKVKEDAINALAIAYLEFARQHPGLYQSTLSVNETLGKEYHETGNKILKLIYDSLIPYQLTDVQLVHVVRGLRSMLHGFVSLEMNEGFGIKISINESILFVLKNYLYSIDQLSN